MRLPQLLGLTGPAGSGKSTVLRWLEERGVATIDADAAVRDVLSHDPALAARVNQRFGAGVMDGPGVDRARLAAVVFADPAALEDLEALVHPVVTARIRAWRTQHEVAARDPAPPWIAVEAIKLVESDLREACQAIWLIVCDRRIRTARLAERGWSSAELARRLASAPPMAPELAAADAVIDTSGPWAHTVAQLDAAWIALIDLGGLKGSPNL